MMVWFIFSMFSGFALNIYSAFPWPENNDSLIMHKVDFVGLT
jgi:hypothetical protein